MHTKTTFKTKSGNYYQTIPFDSSLTFTGERKFIVLKSGEQLQQTEAGIKYRTGFKPYVIKALTYADALRLAETKNLYTVISESIAASNINRWRR